MMIMFRVPAHRFPTFPTTGFSRHAKLSFSSFSSCPSWRKCMGVENVISTSSKTFCHMIKSVGYHQLQNRPISVFHFVRTTDTFHWNRTNALRTPFQNLENCKITKSSATYSKKDLQYQICQYSSKASSSTKGVGMGGKRPGLIVFDLDCTLWPLHVDTTVNPPFIQKDSKIVDQDGKLITYYPEVPQVLEYLKAEGYPIGVASRTTKPPGAEQLLNFFDWNKYISYKEIYPGSKVTHFARFVEKTKLSHEDMLFFDDEQRNIIDMQQQGVKCVFVENGVNLQLVKDSIEKFKNGQL